MSFDFVPQDQNVFSFYLAAYIISHLGKFMFLHRINWPRTRCITFQKNGLRWNWNYKTVFFTPTNIANLSFQKMLKSYRGSLQTEIAFWLLFISCYEKLQPSRYHLQVSKFQHQKISTSQKCVIQHCFSSSGSSLMRKVELSNKPSVKSLQGNKSTTLF